MVIGNGLLANVFKQYINDSKILIFASGVSNSNETKENEFKREEKLLTDKINNLNSKRLIYFSTCAIYDKYFPDNNYIKHKLRMEELISTKCKSYLIFRLPQVFGKNNKFQLIGFLFSKIKNNELFDLYNIERNIISVNDIKIIVNDIIYDNKFDNKIINIGNIRNIKVIDLVQKIEMKLNIKAKYKLIEKEGSFNIDLNDILHIIDNRNIFTINYVDRLINDYE